MEEVLDEYNKSLICEQEEIRKKFFKKYEYLIIDENLLKEEYSFFRRISLMTKDEEFENLINNYRKLKNLSFSIDKLKCSIDELEKKYEI